MEEGAKNTGKGAKKTWNGAIKRKANGSKNDRKWVKKRKARECKMTGKGGYEKILARGRKIHDKHDKGVGKDGYN